MLTWSVIGAVLGCGGSGIWLAVLAARGVRWRPQGYWLLGLAALFPAWLLAFIALLNTAPLTEPLPPPVLFSSGVALLGVVLSDAGVRRLQRRGRALPPVLWWLSGLVALLPGWGVALLALRA
ncbi:MAG: hypothetical protein KatS3mg131_3925 [Candidatus Tectimicrobiota bacterium]|nr:MAG: hypothetical protein KatS3mg131_3925 [Candidatus Tectomicrobia bacterium]